MVSWSVIQGGGEHAIGPAGLPACLPAHPPACPPCRERVGKEERIKRLSAVQAEAYRAVKAMDAFAGVDDATVRGCTCVCLGAGGAAEEACSVCKCSLPHCVNAAEGIIWNV